MRPSRIIYAAILIILVVIGYVFWYDPEKYYDTTQQVGAFWQQFERVLTFTKP